CHQRCRAAGFQLPATIGGTPVLPDDGGIRAASGLPIPDDGGFTLVRDADGGDVGGLHTAPCDRAARDVEGGGPDLLRIVLDPAGLRVMLRELALRGGKRLQAPVENDGAAAARALVDAEQQRLSHPSRLRRSGRGVSRWPCAGPPPPGTRRAAARPSNARAPAAWTRATGSRAASPGRRAGSSIRRSRRASLPPRAACAGTGAPASRRTRARAIRCDTAGLPSARAGT